MAAPDLWNWEVVYDDGEILREVGEGGAERTWRDIDQDRVSAFLLTPTRDGLRSFAQELQPGERLIFLRRRVQLLSPLTGNGQEELRPEGAPYTWHVLGTQQTVAGQNIQRFLFISETGDAFASSDPQANERITFDQEEEEEVGDA